MGRNGRPPKGPPSALRRRRGSKTLAQVSSTTGLSKSYLSDIERGLATYRQWAAVCLANVYGVSFAVIKREWDAIVRARSGKPPIERGAHARAR